MNKEMEIIQQIKLNPFISQQELADKIGISRSAVAGYIANMTKRGIIRGRAYVLKDESFITCIGGANLDRKAISHHKIAFYSSNPVTISESCGGVARNIAENLASLKQRTMLVSVVGDDKEGKWLIEEATKSGIDVSQISMQQGERTGTYTALLDTDGEMVVALADMAIYDRVTVEQISEKWSHISSSNAIFLDTNFPADVLQYIISKAYQQNIPVYIDPVSSMKAKKLPKDLTGVKVILPNKEEAELLSGVPIHSIADCDSACDAIIARGVEHVIITLGEQGIYYGSRETKIQLPPYPVKVVDVTGAGDAFAAGLLFGITNGEAELDACRLGLAASALTVQTEQSVSSLLTAETLYQYIEENEK